MLRLRFTLLTALVVGFLVVACGSTGPEDAADTTTTPDTPTSAPDTTTPPQPDDSPEVVFVPNLTGLTLAEATQRLGEVGLHMASLPENVATAIVIAQEPVPGIEVNAGSVVTVDVQAAASCNPPDPLAPDTGERIITVLYECGGDGIAPTPGVGVPRIVSDQNGEAIDRISWTLEMLLAGPTVDERIAGFVSAFDTATATALDAVTLTEGRLVVEFNDAIVVNNMGTSTGMIFFNAELHRNVFLHPEVTSVEFHFNGDCAAWSALFESDGCRVVTRADWYRDLAAWDNARDA